MEASVRPRKPALLFAASARTDGKSNEYIADQTYVDCKMEADAAFNDCLVNTDARA